MIPYTKAEKTRMRLFKIGLGNPQSVPTILDAIKEMADEALKATLDVAQRQAFEHLKEQISILETNYRRQLEKILGSVDEIIEKKVKAVKPPKGDKGDMWSKEEVLDLIVSVMPRVENGKDAVPPTKEEWAVIVKPVLLEIMTNDSIINRVLEEKDKEMKDKVYGKVTDLIAQEISKIKRFGGGGSGDRVKAGTGVTISTDNSGKKVISVTGGGGVTVETPTGTVNGVNDTFTVTEAPQWIVSDGVTYYENAGYTLAGLTITVDIPPSQYIRAII